MAKPQTSEVVPFNRLSLDTQNPRTDEQTDQQAAILALIDDQKKKLVRLAQDIIDNGLSPAAPFVVIPGSKGSQQLVAVEGNRRLAAMKLVRNPELARDTPLYKSFSKLHKAHFMKLPTEVACVRLATREEANTWIQRLHDRGLEGAGVEGWGSEAKSRFQARQSGRTALEQRLIDEARKLSHLPEDDRRVLQGRVASTTIRRVLDDAGFRKAFGYEIRKDELIGTGDRKRLSNALLQVVLDVAHRRKKVGDVYDKDRRKEYLKELEAKLPGAVGGSGKEWNVLDHFAPNSKHTMAKRMSKKKAAALRADRKRLLSGQLIIDTSKSQKATYLLNEMSKPPIDDYPLLLVFGIRSFVEISCYEYQKRHRFPGVKDQIELHKRIETCADHLVSAGVATAAEMKGARVVAKADKDHVHSTNTINAYVHNAHFVPSPSEVRSLWDRLELFLHKLWQ